MTAEGYVRFYRKIYVPPGRRNEYIRRCHDLVTCGHGGEHATVERIKQHYYFPNMRKSVKEYIANCESCAMNKNTTHPPYGEIQLPKYPERAWQVVTIDWITKLPDSPEPGSTMVYDSIMVVTDRLTKYAYFTPYTEKSTAEDLAYWFNKVVISQHGMPEAVISDRDKWLTSKFWETLTDNLGIKRKITTAYHPQANGQTERTNQTLEQYLRHYVGYRQTD